MDFFHIAIAKKIPRFFPFDRNIAGNIAKKSAKYQVFQAFFSKFHARHFYNCQLFPVNLGPRDPQHFRNFPIFTIK